MKIGFDLDGTIDSDPSTFQSLMAALQAAGHKVFVLTGIDDKKVGPQDVEEKTEYLRELGCGNCYDILKVFPNPPHKAKAKFCRKHNLSLLVDNSVETAEMASKFCTVLLPWATQS